MKIQFIIVFFKILNVIKSDVINNCQLANYCGAVPCSTNGYCDFDISLYYNESFSLEKHHTIKCKCNIGYSSFDIDVLHKNESIIHCCYKQKSHLTAFYLELFLGFGIGHFYIGDIPFGLFKFFVQLFLFLFCWCTMYFACRKEHTIVINLNDINKKEKINVENKVLENQETKDIKEDENIDDIINENKKEENGENNENEDNNEESFDEEEYKISQVLSDDLIKCPKSKFFIIFSAVLFVAFELIDVFLMGFGIHKDKNGEDLNMWN